MTAKRVKRPEPKAPPVGTPEAPFGRAPVTVLDWAAYFREFCLAHVVRQGGYVLDGDRLLFGDGWTCALDHRGPYRAPPTDPRALRQLLGRYWRRRLQIVRAEYRKAADALEGLDELRRNYPLPLLARRVIVTEAGGLAPDPADPTGPVDWTALGARAAWLREDALACELELRRLGETP